LFLNGRGSGSTKLIPELGVQRDPAHTSGDLVGIFWVPKEHAVHALVSYFARFSPDAHNHEKSARHGLHDGKSIRILERGCNVCVRGGVELHDDVRRRMKLKPFKDAETPCLLFESAAIILADNEELDWQILASRDCHKQSFETFFLPIIADQQKCEVAGSKPESFSGR
jgi:hypothetical protein